MYKLFFLILLLERSQAVIYKLNDSEYYKMPPIYALDNYDSCMSDPGATYCMIDVDLLPGNNPQLMKMIQEYSENTLKHFNHSIIHRGVCVTRTCKEYLQNLNMNKTTFSTNGTVLEMALEACLNKSIYSQYSLEGKLADIQYCNKEGEEVELDTSDKIMAVVYLVLIVLNVVGSFYDILFCKKEEKSGNPYLLAFSMRRNWARLTAPSSNPKEPRLERLKVFYGFRTMTMICVLFSHTTVIMSISYVENTLYLERSSDDPLKQLLFNGTLVTHTFFMMSSFLLAYNFMLYTEKHPISWMYLPKGILLRWLRLTPAYALVLGTIVTWMRHMHQGPMWPLIVTSESDSCRQYWWAHLLYVNNYVYDDALCLPQSWYLAADTQLFCLGLLVCVVARTCRARVVTLSVLMVVALALVAGHTYFQDLEAVVLQSPETYRKLYATDDTFRLLYVRGHTNMSTYVLGLAGGFLAYHAQDGKDMDKYKKYRWGMWLLFPLGVAVILTGGVFYIDGVEIPTTVRVLYATFYKPVFQLLIGGFIFGCVFQVETVYRGIVEWRGFTWMGRVSYSAFLLHTMFQRGMAGSFRHPIYITDFYVVLVLCGTILMSYMCACALWLCVEAPAAAAVRAAVAPAHTTDTRTRTEYASPHTARL